MKRFIQYITTFVCLTALFTGCNSDAEMTFLTRDGECKLLATATEVDITEENYQIPVLSLTWNTPSWLSEDDERISTPGITSSYIQVAATEDFSVYEENSTNGLSKAYKAGELNSIANKLGLTVGQEGTLYFRVKCQEGGNIAVYSNVCEVTLTPIYINMSVLDVLSQDKSSTIAHLYSPEENGIYTGIVYASSWMNCWFQEADGNLWGNEPKDGTAFELSNASEAWNCWFADGTGFWYVTVNTLSPEWSCALLNTIKVNDEAMTFNIKKKAWQYLINTTGSTELSFTAEGLLYNKTSRTEAAAAKQQNYAFGVAEDGRMVLNGEGKLLISGSGEFTVTIHTNDNGDVVAIVEAGDQTGDGDTPATPKPTEMKVYDKDGVTLLGTLAKTGDGIYSGDITLTSWQNFLFADLENNIWYGSVPDALTSITSDDSKWNLWISDGAAGTHTIEVNLNTMTWSSQLKEQGGGGSSYPTDLKVYAATDWNNPGATLTATDQEGVYSGTLTTTMEWEQFKIVDGSTWYGADGNKMSVDGGNMWAGGEIGAYTIVANLKEMTWSATKQ